MGEMLTALRKRILGTACKQHRMIVIGPAWSGKTTLLYRLLVNETLTATIDFNIEKLTIQGLDLSLWDIGSDWYSLTEIWRNYAKDVGAVISVVDSTDERQIEEARSQLWRIYEAHEVKLKATVLLVFANKQDCLNALSVAEVKERLELESRAGEGRRWRIQGSVATTGDGLLEGMEWLVAQLKGVT